jgi:hypothetical protein
VTIQSIESYEEQQARLRIACDKMNKYLGASVMMHQRGRKFRSHSKLFLENF